MNCHDWKNTQVSSCGTHHLCDSKPLYAKRFSNVLPFHAPGLAPVRSDDKAWHINIDGKMAYDYMFASTFGFYENLAAVNDTHGWFHIHPDGTPAYANQHSWCGNFQGGQCVVCDNEKYYHIRPDGHPSYLETYAYVGDFREGCAVVKNIDGLCGHILENGMSAHPHRYRNLDVYHKGYACAQDDHGWMHIDRNGMPIYENRYASVEPFYNGRSLVQTFDNNSVVIDSLGDAVVVIMER